jgi:hypothetical protein
LGDEPDVFGYRGMGGTSPLTVDYFVEVVWIQNVGCFHSNTGCADYATAKEG